jgi:succinoglycan biosynthesis transport protein ExoP
VMDLRLYEDPVFNPAWASWGGGEKATPELDQARLGGLGARLVGGLQIAPIKNTQLVAIHYRSTSPELAARIANGITESFIDWGIEDRSVSAGKASNFLGRQIEDLKQELGDKEKTLQAYGRRSDIVSIEPGANPALQQLDALNKDYVQALSARIESEAAYNEALSAPGETVAAGINGTAVAQLRREVQLLEQEYATKSNTYKPDMPVMVELQAKIQNARRNLRSATNDAANQVRQQARAAYQTTRRREEALQAELKRAMDETISYGSASVEYNHLRMDVETRRQIIDELLRRQS